MQLSRSHHRKGFVWNVISRAMNKGFVCVQNIIANWMNILFDIPSSFSSPLFLKPVYWSKACTSQDQVHTWSQVSNLLSLLLILALYVPHPLSFQLYNLKDLMNHALNSLGLCMLVYVEGLGQKIGETNFGQNKKQSMLALLTTRRQRIKWYSLATTGKYWPWF